MMLNCYRCNYRRCEKVQEINYFKYKPNLINGEHREVEIVEIIKEKKVEPCKIIEEIIESFELIKGKDYIN